MSIDDKKAIGLLIQRSGLSLLQSEVMWIEKRKKLIECGCFLDFNGDEKYINTSGIGKKCGSLAEYKIVFRSAGRKFYSKNVCKFCLKNAMEITTNKYTSELK